MKHTNTPYKINKLGDNLFISDVATGRTICNFVPTAKPKTLEAANAEFVCRACNCHDELVLAIRAALITLSDDEHFIPMRNLRETLTKALEKATGEKS